MPINFNRISPAEALTIARDEGHLAATAITKLANEPLSKGETHADRTAKVFRHAINLAAAFDVIEQITAMALEAFEAQLKLDSTRMDLPKAGVSSGIN